MVVGFGIPGSTLGRLCVSPHKSTNASACLGFEPHSWLCAENHQGSQEGRQEG
jgi:hypothetical protein